MDNQQNEFNNQSGGSNINLNKNEQPQPNQYNQGYAQQPQYDYNTENQYNQGYNQQQQSNGYTQQQYDGYNQQYNQNANPQYGNGYNAQYNNSYQQQSNKNTKLAIGIGIAIILIIIVIAVLVAVLLIKKVTSKSKLADADKEAVEIIEGLDTDVVPDYEYEDETNTTDNTTDDVIAQTSELPANTLLSIKEGSLDVTITLESMTDSDYSEGEKDIVMGYTNNTDYELTVYMDDGQCTGLEDTGLGGMYLIIDPHESGKADTYLSVYNTETYDSIDINENVDEIKVSLAIAGEKGDDYWYLDTEYITVSGLKTNNPKVTGTTKIKSLSDYYNLLGINDDSYGGNDSSSDSDFSYDYSTTDESNSSSYIDVTTGLTGYNLTSDDDPDDYVIDDNDYTKLIFCVEDAGYFKLPKNFEEWDVDLDDGYKREYRTKDGKFAVTTQLSYCTLDEYVDAYKDIYKDAADVTSRTVAETEDSAAFAVITAQFKDNTYSYVMVMQVDENTVVYLIVESLDSTVKAENFSQLAVNITGNLQAN
jgi:flagellar basal body-associated protein FliL